jgi:hypothetical protein
MVMHEQNMHEQNYLARDSISSKRIKFDELLHNIPGVQFFISLIIAIEASRGDDDDAIFPAVAYFIVYSHSKHQYFTHYGSAYCN